MRTQCAIKAISLKPSISCWLCWFSPQNSKYKSVIDEIAPVKLGKNSGRQKSPLVHYYIYKDSIRAFTMELGKARHKTDFLLEYYKQQLNKHMHSFCYCRETDNPLPKPDSQWNALRQHFRSAVSFLLSSLRKSIISERWSAHPWVALGLGRSDHNWRK